MDIKIKRIKMRFLIIFLLLTSVCFAQEIKFDKVNFKYIDKKGKVYNTIDVPLVSDFTFKKPNISEIKILTEDERDVVEYALKETGRKLIHKELKPLKNDYHHDFDRGTVEYNPHCKNYSFHKVVIPDGTIIKNMNFTQKKPHTQAIIGKNLIFIDCNLINVELDPTWKIENCNIAQIKFVKKAENNVTDLEGNILPNKKKIIISHQVETPRGSGKYMEVEESVQEVNIGDEYNLLMLRLNQ